MAVSVKNSSASDPADARLQMHVKYFTDPLCCWSWVLGPHLDELQRLFPGRINMQYIMGGMIPSWDKFYDESNAISHPAQMGPVWMHAAQLTGRPINYLLWMKDPPASSYPACIAVKCVQLQSTKLGDTYFKRVQQAAMTEVKNVASWPVLEGLARQLASEQQSFSLKQFTLDYEQQNGALAFRADLDLVACYKITRFPTLLIDVPDRKSIVITGYRTFDGLTDALTQAFDMKIDRESQT